MTSLHVEDDEPLVAMPAQRLPELRRAVAIVAPDLLPELFEEMEQAFMAATDNETVAPIRLFYRRWAVTVAIERRPETARRLHAAERVVNGPDRASSDEAIREIGEILRIADREVDGGGSG